MPLKIHSNMLINEHCHYTLAADENILLPIKARPGEVICVHAISIYNNSGGNYGACYKLLRTGGHLCRLDYTAGINAGVVRGWAVDVYLRGNDECGVAITPAAAGDTVCVNFQVIRFKDDDYFKPT